MKKLIDLYGPAKKDLEELESRIDTSKNGFISRKFILIKAEMHSMERDLRIVDEDSTEPRQQALRKRLANGLEYLKRKIDTLKIDTETRDFLLQHTSPLPDAAAQRKTLPGRGLMERRDDLINEPSYL